MNDVVEFKRSRPLVKYRYLIMPSGHVASGINMINFNPKNTQPMIDLGIKDAGNALALGEGYMFAMAEKYVEKPEEFRQKISFE